MTLILTNDDGIDAPGLQALFEAVQPLGRPITIAAPRDHQSGCGHQVTTQTPIRVDPRLAFGLPATGADASPPAFAIAGTPADCTRLALMHLCAQAQWVLSGINAGGNLGSDVYISGTVAAVREAALHRVPGIALSHFIQRGRAIDWALATALTRRVLMELMSRPPEPGSFWNVNLPHLTPGDASPELVFCPACTQPLPADYRIEAMGATDPGDGLEQNLAAAEPARLFHYAGNYGARKRDHGADVEVCFAGKIAVTQIWV